MFSCLSANFSNQQLNAWKKKQRTGFRTGRRRHWMRFTSIGDVTRNLATIIVVFVGWILPTTSITHSIQRMHNAGLKLLKQTLLLLNIRLRTCVRNQACKQAEQAEQDPCSVSSRGLSCSARLGLGEQQDARSRSRLGRAETVYARFHLHRDRYRAGLALRSARSAREFSYVRTSLIALVAHKISLWKAINQFCVLQVG